MELYDGCCKEHNNSYNISLKIYLSYLNPILSIIQSLIIIQVIKYEINDKC